MSFIETLKELIEEKETSLRQIAKISDFSSGQLSEYLHGAYPTVEKAIKLAKFFDCSLDYLFGLSEERNYKSYNERQFDINLFIERYQKLLKENKTTHYKFAKRSELAESIIRHWRKGHKPLTDKLLFIAYGLNCSIDYLVGRID